MRKLQRPDFSLLVKWLDKNLKAVTQVGLVLCLALVSVAYIRLFNPEAFESAFSPASRALPVYNVETEEKKVAISFDAAWGEEKTDEILKILKDHDVHTTFFLVGYWVDKYPDHVKQIADAGHEIGNHSNTHPHMSELSSSDRISGAGSSSAVTHSVISAKYDASDSNSISRRMPSNSEIVDASSR